MSLSATFFTACTAFINGANALAGVSREQARQTSEAIKALTKAIHETEIYFAERQRDVERDFEREQQLSRFWSETAEPLRVIGESKFSELCALKAHYWLFPDHYERESIRALNITLEGMNAGLQKLRFPS